VRLLVRRPRLRPFAQVYPRLLRKAPDGSPLQIAASDFGRRPDRRVALSRLPQRSQGDLSGASTPFIMRGGTIVILFKGNTDCAANFRLRLLRLFTLLPEHLPSVR
jgi:hypothetical protein